MVAASNARAIVRGLRFRPLAETARDTLAWWKAQPEERRVKLAAGLAPEKEQAVLTAWHASRAR
jgi:2'-hydroxyisoflavone reductase